MQEWILTVDPPRPQTPYTNCCQKLPGQDVSPGFFQLHLGGGFAVLGNIDERVRGPPFGAP